MLSLRCNKREVLLAGLFKEILDSVGPGDADSEDFVADKYGIGLVSMQRARTDTECLEQCDLKY